jgi:hypothetical protein
MPLGTIHKRRLLRGVGRWGPPKGDLRRRGVDTLILVKETSPFLMPKKLQGQLLSDFEEEILGDKIKRGG